ncbi:MAG: tetratricopeptide repeat protein [Bryobacteraceae bacterium]|nr:tetratricopeptide repeat protein [Bryobacteraceae bacterium]
MKSLHIKIAVVTALTVAVAIPSSGQTAQPAAPAQQPAKSQAYYHAALAHLYAELAAQYGGRGEYVTKAIENYKTALAADPDAAFLASELADMYLQTGRLRSATAEFEDLVRKNPNDLNSRRILARFYTARIRDGQQGRPNQEMLNSALEQYRILAEKAPGDVDNLVTLARLEKFALNSSAAEAAYKKALAVEPENEEALTGLALVYGEMGNNELASQMLSRAAQKNPNLRTLTALASAYEQMRDYKMAAATYGQALDLNRENTDLKRAYAQALFVAEDIDKALSVFEEIVTEEPNDLLANLRLSQIHRQKRNFDKARSYARKARDLDPSNIEIRFNEVGLFEAEGKTAEAISLLKELTESTLRTLSMQERGNGLILLERLGLLYRSNEQTQEAVAAFQRMAQVDSNAAPNAAAQIIDTYRAGKDFAAAEREMQAALAKHPDDRILKSVAATLLSDLGRHAEAEKLLKSLFDGKNDRAVHIALAQAYDKAKDYKAADRALDEAEKLSETNDEKEPVLFLRGALFEKQKRYDEAEKEFRRVLDVSPNNASALNYLGYMLADRNIRVQEALALIQKAVDQEPANGAFLDSLGWVYYRLNKLDEAADYLRRSLQRGTKDPTVHDHLGDVYLGQGNLKDAINHWEIAVNEWRSNAPSDRDDEAVAKIQKKLEGAKVRLARESAGKDQKQR